MRTTVVGSYPAPSWLRSSLTRENLRDAMMVVLKTQELAGIELLADGELYRWNGDLADRGGGFAYFAGHLGGVRTALTQAELASWRENQGRLGGTASGREPSGVVAAEIDAGGLNLRAAYAEFRSLTTFPTKFTVASPYALARHLSDAYYGDPHLLMVALAEVLIDQVNDLNCDVLQIDEPLAAASLDDAAMAVSGLNMVLSCVQAETGVHLCSGPDGGGHGKPLDLAPLIQLINLLQVDHVVLELSRQADAEIPRLREIRPEIRLGIGVIDVHSTGIECPAVVAKRIQRVADAVGVDRIAYVHPDCGLWNLPRDVADRKLRMLVRGRNEFLGDTAPSALTW